MLQAISDLARQAGEMILRAHQAPVHQKEGHFNYVTDTDVAVQRFLRRELLALCPQAAFLGEEEESAGLTNAPTFVVDPIDGTINFMRNRRQSAVSIGLLADKRPVLGVIYQPYADELFTAEKGKGAFCNGQAVHASATPLEQAVVAFGTAPYDAELAEKSMAAARAFLLRAGDLRRTGSAAVELCDVACGRADVFFELRLRPWDVAAGSLIVAEAGGGFFSLGKEAPYYDGPCGVLAVNAPCREAARAILEAVL